MGHHEAGNWAAFGTLFLTQLFLRVGALHAVTRCRAELSEALQKRCSVYACHGQRHRKAAMALPKRTSFAKVQNSAAFLFFVGTQRHVEHGAIIRASQYYFVFSVHCGGRPFHSLRDALRHVIDTTDFSQDRKVFIFDTDLKQSGPTKYHS